MCTENMLNIHGGSIHYWIVAIAGDNDREETMKLFLDVKVNQGENYYDDVDTADEAMEDIGDNSAIIDTERF